MERTHHGRVYVSLNGDYVVDSCYIKDSDKFVFALFYENNDVIYVTYDAKLLFKLMSQIKPTIYVTEKSSAILFIKIQEYFKGYPGYDMNMKKRYPILKFLLLKEIMTNNNLLDIIGNVVSFTE